LRFKRKQLEEKLKQLKILVQMNNGELPKEYVDWAKTEEVIDRHDEVSKLRLREEDLLKQIQDITKQLDRLGP
jgi:hypothetical protein